MVQQLDSVNIRSLTAQQVTLPAASVTAAMIQPGALILATDQIHQSVGIGSCLELFGPAVSVAALTKVLFMARSSGTLLAFGAWIEVVASGADRTITVDLKKSTGAGAYATVLSGTAGFTNVTAVRTLISGTISSPNYVLGDIFECTVVVAGAAGAQATGLSVKLNITEAPT